MVEKSIAKEKQKKTLRVQIITAVTVLVTFVAVASGIFTAYSTYKSTKTCLTKSMTATAQVSSQTATKEISKLVSIAQGVAADSTLTNPESTPDQISALLNSKSKNYDFVDACYYNTTGLNVVGNDNCSSSEFFQKSINGETYISSPYVDEASKELVIMVSTPVWMGGVKDSTVIGVTAFLVKQQVINAIVENIKVSENGIAYMVDKSGYTIADLDVQLVKDKENIPQLAKSNASIQSLASIYTKAIAGGTGFGTYKYKGVNKFVAYAPVEGTDGWSFFVGAPEKDFTQGVTTAIYTAIFITIISIIIGFVIATVMTKSLEVALAGVMARLTAFAGGDVFSPMPNFESNSFESVNLKKQTEIATENTGAIIRDIDYLMTEMAHGNFDILSKVPDKYIGDYENILKSFRGLKSSINESFHGIAQVSEQVAAGASQVSFGAQTLSQGATEQASSIQELSASIEDISQRVKENAEGAEKAKTLTAETETIMQGSVSDMDLARQAMDEISATSKNIGKVIKTIDDIAFQTNILALNAAVEAARAGAAGKGFAVVADEVRNLSQKSAEAAKNTTTLIESSIEAVEKGTQLVNRTSNDFVGVAQKSAEVARLVDTISVQAQEQASAISQVSIGIEQVSAIVQMNSATSEESAAASEQLSSQAEVLKGLVGQFRLTQE